MILARRVIQPHCASVSPSVQLGSLQYTSSRAARYTGLSVCEAFATMPGI